MDYETARKIITDRSHPLHARYVQGDAEIMRQVSEAYAQQFPGTVEITDRQQNWNNGGE